MSSNQPAGNNLKFSRQSCSPPPRLCQCVYRAKGQGRTSFTSSSCSVCADWRQTPTGKKGCFFKIDSYLRLHMWSQSTMTRTTWCRQQGLIISNHHTEIWTTDMDTLQDTLTSPQLQGALKTCETVLILCSECRTTTENRQTSAQQTTPTAWTLARATPKFPATSAKNSANIRINLES